MKKVKSDIIDTPKPSNMLLLLYVNITIKYV